MSAQERFAAILSGAREVIRPSLFGTMIIAVVYLPVLTLTGVEGRMFTPMALTVLMALLGAALFSMTFVPAAVALLVTGKVSETENTIMGAVRRAYMPLLRLAIRFRRSVVLAAAAVVVVSGFAATRMRCMSSPIGGQAPSVKAASIAAQRR